MCEWLIRLAGENLAVSAFVGAVWSFVVEMFPQFDLLPPAVKRWVMLALCLASPLLALILAANVFGCAILVNANTIAAALAAGMAAFMGSQVAHIRKL